MRLLCWTLVQKGFSRIRERNCSLRVPGCGNRPHRHEGERTKKAPYGNVGIRSPDAVTDQQNRLARACATRKLLLLGWCYPAWIREGGFRGNVCSDM